MYFFYLDESGTRDPSIGTPENPREHIYVLLAIGLYERRWRPFEREISQLKLGLVSQLQQAGKGQFELADCEVKSSWLRIPGGREKHSPFLNALSQTDLERIANIYFDQVANQKAVVIASVIDKRYLCPDITQEKVHSIAYEFLLERIQRYLKENHPRHLGLIVMDDTDKKLNRSIAMRHAALLREGNLNIEFPNIVEYPFFTRSELSNGVQLADQLAYNVYRAFRDENAAYPYFKNLLGHFYADRAGLRGLKVWPENSPLISLGLDAWGQAKKEPSTEGG